MITKQMEKFKSKEEVVSFPELKNLIKESLVGAKKIWQSVGSAPTVSTFFIEVKEIEFDEEEDVIQLEINGDRQLSIEIDCNSNVLIRQPQDSERLNLYFKDYHMWISAF